MQILKSAVALPRVLAVFSAALILIAALSLEPVWVFSNDAMNNLKFAYDIDAGHAFLREFQKTASANCLGVQRCINDTEVVILSSLKLNYPSTWLAAQWLTQAVDTMPFLDAVARATLFGSLAATGVAALLYLLPVWGLPRDVLMAVGVASCVTGLIPWFSGFLPLQMPEFLLHPRFFGQQRGALLLAGGTFVMVLLYWVAVGRYFAALRERSIVLICGVELRSLAHGALAIAFTCIACRILLPPSAALQAAILLAWASITVGTAVALRLTPGIALALALIVFAITNIRWFAFFPTFPSPLGASSLAVTGVMVYAAMRPNGRLLWLMPLGLVFHVGAAGLLAFAVVVTEILICLYRRRVSGLLLSAGATALASAAWSLASFDSDLVGGFGVHGMRDLVPLLLPGLMKGALVAAPLLTGAGLLLHQGRGRFDGSARAAIIAAEVIVWARISTALIDAGIDPIDPRYHSFIYLFDYLGAMLGFWPVLVVAAELASSCGLTIPDPTVRRHAQKLAMASVVALLAARGAYYLSAPDGRVAAVREGASFVVHPGAIEPRDAMVRTIRFDDDEYVLRISPEQRPNDPLTYAYLLKFALRVHKDVFDPSRASLTIVDARSGPNWARNATQAVRRDR